MQKIVINKCVGGRFSLTDEVFEEYLARKGISFTKGPHEYYEERSCFYDDKGNLLEFDRIPRTDPTLIQLVEENNGVLRDYWASAVLIVVEVPDGVQWEIVKYDGDEAVHECHKVFG